MNEDQLRQLLNQTDAATAPPGTGDLLGEAIRRRHRLRFGAGVGVMGAGMLLLAFSAGVWVEARNRPIPVMLAPSSPLLLQNPSQPLAPLPDESEFKLEQAVLIHGVDGMPPWQPATIQRLEIQY